MCIDPFSLSAATYAAIAAGASAAAGIGGSIMSAKAQSANASAIAEQNQATQRAQNEAFGMRMNAQLAQTAAQRQAGLQTLDERNAALAEMRQQQMSAQQRQQDILAAENQQADKLRQTGDTAAQELLTQTSQQRLAEAQESEAARTQALLAQSGGIPAGPGPSDPAGTGDSETQKATTRRLAEAASNVRDYGARVAALHAYDAPTRDVGLAIAANKIGIMPAQTAETLLRSGSNTRLLPASVAWRNAGDLGGAMDTLIQSKGQNLLDAANLAAGNKVSLANLFQSDQTTIAANKAKQAQADAQAQAAMGGIVSGIGNLGLYGAGYIGGGGSLFGLGGDKPLSYDINSPDFSRVK